MASGTPTATIASLQRISREELSALLTNSSGSSAVKTAASKLPAPNPIAVVDVRDDDHIGGHIKGSIHAPSRDLEEQIPELVDKLKDAKTVVFHCTLSQQRGPTAALKYMRERAKRQMGGRDGDDKDKAEKAQEVLVLDGGFQRWQET